MDKSLILRKLGDSAVLREESVESGSIVTVGSDPGATIELEGPEIAPEQFVVIDEDSETVLMNRADGTELNGEKLRTGARMALSFGDEIEVGAFSLFFGEHLNEAGASKAPSVQEPELAKAAAVTTTAGGSVARQEDGRDFAEDSVGHEKSSEKVDASSQDESEDKKDFSKILNELREDDTFYFKLRDDEGVVQRIPFLRDQMWIGTKIGNVAIEGDNANLEEVFARVQKDWSGVVVFPRNDQQVMLNGVKLEEPERLRNDDKLGLIEDFKDETLEASVSFHEPLSLLALSSFLPAELPEPVSTEVPESENERKAKSENAAMVGSGAGLTTRPRMVFGYYTIIEIIVMAFGTLVTAAIIFFVLEMV